MPTNSDIKLHESWLVHLEPEFEKEYMLELKAFLKAEKNQGKTIYPPGSLIFNALNTTPLDKVKVVLLGQDPYHGPGQAHGLSFSVPEGVRIPPSLRNIYKELAADCAISAPTHGNLTSWAEQGVLLLNATLTVEQGQAGAHQKKGWETFTDRVIQIVNAQCNHCVFILWGSYAHKKSAMIDTSKHLVLKSVHPSPLSAQRGFFGSKPFSQTNEYLSSHQKTPIDWQIT